MTLPLTPGCYVRLRDGSVHGPLVRPDPNHLHYGKDSWRWIIKDPEGQYPAKPRGAVLLAWGPSGRWSRLGDADPLDIVAVVPAPKAKKAKPVKDDRDAVWLARQTAYCETADGAAIMVSAPCKSRQWNRRIRQIATRLNGGRAVGRKE